jgi:hypothetical protein
VCLFSHHHLESWSGEVLGNRISGFIDERFPPPSEKHFWAGIDGCSVAVLMCAKSKIEEDLSDQWWYGLPVCKWQAWFFTSERDSMSKRMLKQSQNRPMILLLLSLAMFMVILDSAIINVALPATKAALHFDTSSLQWVLTAYILTFGGFLMLGGRTADLFGRLVAELYHFERVS